MTDLATPPLPPPPKLLSTLAAKLKLAAACILALVIGAATAPRAVPSALQTPTERPAPLLEEQVQTRIVSQPFRGVADLAARVGTESVAIPPSRAPVAVLADHTRPPATTVSGGYGVFVSSTDILTNARAVDGRTSLTVTGGDGTKVDAEVVAYEPETDLVLLRTAVPASPPIGRATAVVSAGTLVVAAARIAGRVTLVPGYIVHVEDREYTVSGADAELRPGMPLYTLDGELFAVAAAGGRAHAIADATDRLRARVAAGEPLSALGISYQAVTGALTRAFGERGVLINTVVAGGPAEAAGLVPGDVLLAVGDTAVTIDTVARALSQLPAASAVPVRVRRRGREQTVAVTPMPAFVVAALASRSSTSTMAPLAGSILPADVLERAGVPPTARILRINQREALSRAGAARELTRDPRAVLLVQDGERVFFTALEPS